MQEAQVNNELPIGKGIEGLAVGEDTKLKNWDAEIYLGKNILTIINVTAINETEAIQAAAEKLKIHLKKSYNG